MTDNLLDGSDQNVIDESTNYLEQLIGPGGKFHHPDREVAIQNVARGKIEADRQVASVVKDKNDLYQDLLSLREQQNATANLAELVDRLKQQQTLASSNTNNNANEVVNPPPALDLSQIEQMVSESFSKKTRE